MLNEQTSNEQLWSWLCVISMLVSIRTRSAGSLYDRAALSLGDGPTTSPRPKITAELETISNHVTEQCGRMEEQRSSR